MSETNSTGLSSSQAQSPDQTSPNGKTLLKINELRTVFGDGEHAARVVDGVSLQITKGETFALLGESGCGKSMTSLSIMRLVPEAGRIAAGQVSLNGEDLLQLPESRMRDIRGRRIAMIFQEPMTSLNPVLTIGKQIQETVLRHNTVKEGQSAKDKVLDLLQAVGIPDPPRRFSEYPHQLSGGMKQRVMIAIALAGDPELLIADEPTTALDVTIQAQVLALLKDIQQETGMAVMLITHDLGVVAHLADRIAVMYAGQIVETANREAFFTNPQHPYSKKLFDSLPDISKRQHSLAVIKGFVPTLDTRFNGCRFEPRCELALSRCANEIPQWIDLDDSQGARCHLLAQEDNTGSVKKQQSNAELDVAELNVLEQKEQAETETKTPEDLLKVKGLKVHFPIHKGLFRRVVGQVKAVDDISLNIQTGKTLALVGESGCGKTTAGKGILQLLRPTAGRILLDKDELSSLNKSVLRQRRKDIQIIFQDPFSSMNPRMMVADIIEEGMIAQSVGGNAEQRQQRVDQLLQQVGLSADIKYRYPHEFSGGQRQRICIARALALEPRLIICDEPTSALDVSVQAQILNLLRDLQQQYGLAYLFITHDLSVVEYLAHDVAVMYLGRIVEQGPVKDVLSEPLHPYTRALLSAVPSVDIHAPSEFIPLRGELPSPSNPPVGCHFNPRCKHAFQKCRNGYPQEKQIKQNHTVRCYLYDE